MRILSILRHLFAPGEPAESETLELQQLLAQATSISEVEAIHRQWQRPASRPFLG